MDNASRPDGISVLICTYNGASRLMPTLEHLAKQAIISTIPWEIILVDNNSNDNTLAHSIAQWERCGAPAQLHPLSQPKPGKQFALEVAYNAARYSLMCIVDDDNWLRADYLQRGYDIMQADTTIGLLGGSNTGAFEIPAPSWFPAFQASYAVGEPVTYSAEGKRNLATGEVAAGTLWGAGLFIRHSMWCELQVLHFQSLFTGRQGDKQLVAGEDDELCFVARLLGYKIWYDEQLRCTHYMTAGRLNESYLKRLCYASSRAYPTMSAYQRMMAPDWTKYHSLTPWLKDWVYITLRSVQSVLTKTYVKSFFRPNLIFRVQVNQLLLAWYYFTTNFATCRKNFEKVAAFNERIKQFRAHAKISLSQAQAANIPGSSSPVSPS
jgi:glycosyltransferase involved in cell wall biosynthesis